MTIIGKTTTKIETYLRILILIRLRFGRNKCLQTSTTRWNTRSNRSIGLNLCPMTQFTKLLSHLSDLSLQVKRETKLNERQLQAVIRSNLSRASWLNCSRRLWRIDRFRTWWLDSRIGWSFRTGTRTINTEMTSKITLLPRLLENKKI